MADQELSLSELLTLRREKLQELRSIGVNPFAYEFDVNTSSKDIKKDDSYISDPVDSGKRVSVAGRIMTRRIMGKAAFSTFRTKKELFRCTFDAMTLVRTITIPFSRN